VWVPVDPQGLTYGSNGFKLLFEDPSDLGKDYSGNGNDFTATGFETADTSSSDYDLMLDSPTQNWATLNPIAIDYPAYFPKTKKANLAGDTSGAEADLAMFDTIALPPGKWYYEATFVTDLYLGIAEVFNKTNNRVAFVAKTGTIVREGTFTDSTESTTIGILGSGTLCCKVDTEAREIAYSIDGNVWDTTTYLEPKSSALYAYFSAGIIQPSSGSLSINFGQQPFIHTPPTGFKALQTQNMPAAPIPNGREHFQVLTGLGGEYYGNAIFTDNVNVSQSATPNTATTEFKGSNRGGCVSGGLGTRTLSGDPPGSWIVFRPDAPFENVTSLRIRVEHNYLGAAWVNDSPVDLSGKLNPGTTDWVDITPDVTPFTLRNFADKGTSSPAAQGTLYAIEINGVVLSGGLLEAAQATFPNSLIWIKDRANSNQHQLVDSVRTNGFAIQTPSLGAAVAYVAPAGSSVAWCWNAPEAFTSTDGSIASAGMRNVDAGFSIIEYTGNSIAGATVGHGLSRAPEFMLVRDYAASNKLHYCYSEEIGNESYMYLQGSVPAGANSNIYWNSTSPTDTVFTLGVDANINAGGSQVICYAWHSVPNYSAFGSYQGNSDPNGPFIYTGFRPAFVLYKCSTTTGNWSIRDSIRNTANPANAALFPNQSRDELVNSGNDVDLLSNGFKLRDNDIIQNGTGSYVYAAFAENPFQSPATAR
jgi:hypothetical protein